ncbi:protein CYSTEINE-RICH TRANSMEMBRANE MODULE 6-like [Primulina eburnea]|uniref:protein CYSTEINE-RICH TRANSMEMBRANE MODULE 6-like n=1 Tax=Primulina eburnea TaxID=1245227 RepID=UPI003C6C389A
MSNYDQTQAVYPPPRTANPADTHGYVTPPPPAGYPTNDGSEVQARNPSSTNTTKSRGDGFWKGCCAALCCCCALDACF